MLILKHLWVFMSIVFQCQNIFCFKCYYMKLNSPCPAVLFLHRVGGSGELSPCGNLENTEKQSSSWYLNLGGPKQIPRQKLTCH